ncbi:MAG: Bug family tripartite tricarboxylate transporter substrate binding protein [Burkholderiales bacterium]
MPENVAMFRCSLALLTIALCAGAVHAQQYPARPIRFISPYPAGGGNDTLLRIIGEKLGDQVGQRIIVDNRPGANTIVGTELLVKSAPDGYTFILVPNSFATNPSFYPKLPYDTTKDVATVGQIAQSPQMIVAHPSVPVKTVKDVLAMAKTKPDVLSYGTSGNGSTGHLAGVLLSMMTGVQLTHVAYKGTAPAVNELVGGHIPLMISSMLATLPHVRSGKLKIIVLTTGKRSQAIPEVPTIAESGVPDYEAELWFGIIAPAATPDAIIDKINAEVTRFIKSDAMKAKLAAQGARPIGSTRAEFTAFMRAEQDKWGKVLKEIQIKPE